MTGQRISCLGSPFQGTYVPDCDATRVARLSVIRFDWWIDLDLCRNESPRVNIQTVLRALPAKEMTDRGNAAKAAPALDARASFPLAAGAASGQGLRPSARLAALDPRLCRLRSSWQIGHSAASPVARCRYRVTGFCSWVGLTLRRDQDASSAFAAARFGRPKSRGSSAPTGLRRAGALPPIKRPALGRLIRVGANLV
jgi:hypothetical protein